MSICSEIEQHNMCVITIYDCSEINLQRSNNDVRQSKATTQLIYEIAMSILTTTEYMLH